MLVKVHGWADLDAFHLVIAAADRKAHADVVVEHDSDAATTEVGNHRQDSHVSTTFIQEWAKTAKHVGNHRIHVGKGASLRHSVVTLGGDIVRIRMDQDFGGEQGRPQHAPASTSSIPASTSSTARWWCTITPTASPA